MHFFIILIAAIISATLAVKYVREKKLKEKVEQRLPAENLLTWREEPVSENKNSTNFSKEWKEAATLGALGSIPSLYYLNKIDPEVMDAIDFAFAEDLSNFNDLHNYIEDTYMSAFSTEAADGWMTRLEGYVTEQHAVEVLEKLGYDVQFPENANQAGFDLLVDGEPWQVKGGETISVLDSHFETYSDIPVITSQQLAEQYQGIGEVKGYGELNPNLMESTTEESLKSLDNLGDTMGAGIPVITMVVSGYRELQLLNSGKTDSGRSIENIGWDVAGTGGGGFAGAQIGAGVGAIGGPVGAAIGGIIGGIAGAVGGKYGANKIKERYLRQAVDDYETQVIFSQINFDIEQGREKKILMGKVVQVTDDLNNYKDELLQKHQADLHQKSQIILEKQRLFIEKLSVILAEIKQELEAQKAVLFQGYVKPNRFKRFVAATEADLFYEEADKWFHDRFAILDQAIRRVKSEAFREQDLKFQIQEIIDFFNERITDNERLKQNLHEVYLEQLSIKDVRDKNKRQMFDLVRKSEEEIKKHTTDSFRKLQEVLQEQQEIIKGKLDEMRKEREKLGY